MTKNKKKYAHAGAPAFYENPQDLQEKIEEYFDHGHTVKKLYIKVGSKKIPIEKHILTISGLVLYCGFSDRQSFYDMEKRSEFSHTIKRARERIAQSYEELLCEGLGVGAIFALKNFGWKDKSEVEHTGEIMLALSENLKEARSRLSSYEQITQPQSN